MRALIFDLDGTLVDSVYGHVLAFQIAFAEAGLPVEAWRIHRHIGMSGDLLTQAMARNSGHKVSAQKSKRIEKRHSHLLRKLLPKPEPLPGTAELLKDLRRKRILHGIATSGKPEEMKIATRALQLSPNTLIVNRSDVERAKPEPDLFLECQKRWVCRLMNAMPWATRSGTFWPPAARACCQSACSLVVMEKTSLSERERIAFSRTPEICTSIWVS
jgi:beta-phosphoglucomutase-like phosphatase (HAD superfamily)